MREIKFRAWDKKEKLMVELYSIPLPNVCGEGRGGMSRVYMQYTDLKDKDGNDIYEGDIIETRYYNFIKKHWARWRRKKVITYKKYIWHQGFNIAGGTPGKTEYRIIGNIYENPELLQSNA